MKCAIYARVSTMDQNSELQIRDIQEYAARQGWNIVEIYLKTEYALRSGDFPCHLLLLGPAGQGL